MDLRIQALGLSETQLSAVSEVAGDLNVRLEEGGLPVRWTKGGRSIRIRFDGRQGAIEYGQDHQFIRALGRFAELVKRGEPFEIAETQAYDSLGFMADCSRNAVLHTEGCKALIRKLALMGYQALQLYTEDTYELAEYPYFGYMRGRYSGEELREIDRYAGLFGIELVPCIQTLAHLGTALKWQSHAHLVDCQDILLIDEPRTYELIDRMFAFMAEHVASRRINIGMDEAHMMGLGKYLDKHGYRDRSELMLKHFGKVMEIARRYGYRPMMWSDMFFRLASAGEYYDADSPIRADVAEMIPDDVTLVYWDYYSESPERYDGMLRKHKHLGERIAFAGGAWKWMGFAPNNRFSRHVGLLAHESCRKNGIREVLMTAWGDNGAEASVFAVLPVLQLWAELCYAGRSDEDYLRVRFRTCANGDYDDFMDMDAANLVPGNDAPGGCSVNPAKYLLYQDILCGLFDKHVIPSAYAEHFGRCAARMAQAAGRNPAWRALFETQASLCRLLELKCEAGLRIRDAYRRGDRATLARFAGETLPELADRAGRFIDAYREQWDRENRIFGLDVFDLRMGGLLQRIRTAARRLGGYASGELARLEELEQEILPFDGMADEREPRPTSANLWHTIATPSVIAGV
ncbi:family 20 glycosylhydrolase [Cohnella sp. JJ-181]|uniref:family 20 glycosylhydrolase n=1 Tax=Cohnella rhizoplanae TaxID=2974897 RepID=UPI0022FFA064|nr:family 20 glycosylhydrolase [Cohnella sp. JJ-181]CAI6083753.1 hypothetical protein COHCIP112018_04106 [Cohnella sp. JJ-181]